MQTQSSISDAVTIAPEPWLTSKQAATLLGVHPKTLERKARAGEIPGYFRLNRWFYKHSELDRWITGDIHSTGQPCRVN
jgi:excisionase family DNA binding protein